MRGGVNLSTASHTELRFGWPKLCPLRHQYLVCATSVCDSMSPAIQPRDNVPDKK